MAITGVLDYNVGLVGSMPNDFFCAIGDDGLHYIVGNHDFAPGGPRASYVSKIDTQSLYTFVLTEAAFAADVATLGLGSPAFGGTLRKGKTATIAGTNLVLSFGYANGSSSEAYWIWYHLVDGVTLTPFAGGHKVCGPAASGVNEYGTVGSSFFSSSGREIFAISQPFADDNVRVVMRTGAAVIVGPQVWESHLITLPLSGIHVDLAIGSWTPHLLELPYNPDTFWTNDGSPARTYYIRASIFDYGDGQHLGVLCYLSYYIGVQEGAGGAVCYHTKVDYLAETTNGKNNVNSLFGIPFDDMLKNFAGALTSDPYNDYSSPTIIQGPGGEIDIFFMRAYSDQKRFAGRRFFQIPAGGEITDIVRGGFAQGEVIEGAPSLNPTIRGVYGFREGSTFYTMVQTFDSYCFGNLGAYPTVGTRRWLAEAGPIRRVV